MYIENARWKRIQYYARNATHITGEADNRNARRSQFIASTGVPFFSRIELVGRQNQVRKVVSLRDVDGAMHFFGSDEQAQFSV